MKQITKNKRETTLAVATVVVLVGILIFVTIIEPQLKRHATLDDKLRELQIQLTQMKSDMRIKDRIEQMYSQIEPLIASDRTDQQEISLLTRQLNDLYASRPLKIRSVKILPITQAEFYKQVSVKIEMSGKIKDIIAFVNSIEQYTQPITIERFDLRASDRTDHVRVWFRISKIITNQTNTT